MRLGLIVRLFPRFFYIFISLSFYHSLFIQSHHTPVSLPVGLFPSPDHKPGTERLGAVAIPKSSERGMEHVEVVHVVLGSSIFLMLVRSKAACLCRPITNTAFVRMSVEDSIVQRLVIYAWQGEE